MVWSTSVPITPIITRARNRIIPRVVDAQVSCLGIRGISVIDESVIVHACIHDELGKKDSSLAVFQDQVSRDGTVAHHPSRYGIIE